MSAESSPALQYVEAVRHTLDRMVETQLEHIEQAALICTGVILKGGLVHLFGSGHSRMAVEEMYPRYGSFPGFHPLVELSLSNHHQVVGNNGQRQAMFIENAEGFGSVILSNFRFDPALDVMMVISAGGANSVPVEVALEAKRLALPVIAITAVEHSRLSSARHSSGRRLFEVADVVIDTCTPPGDAGVHVPNLDTPVGPLTTIACATIINMIKCEVAAQLTAAGKPPSVLTSSVLVGRERSDALFEASYDEFRARSRRL